MDSWLQKRKFSSQADYANKSSEYIEEQIGSKIIKTEEDHPDDDTACFKSVGDIKDSSDGMKQVPSFEVTWKKLSAENLDVRLCTLYSSKQANDLLCRLEEEIEWNTGKLAQVYMFGQWKNIPRKQAAYGDEGLTYTFSGNTVPAKEWTPLLADIRDRISALTGHRFNFVLVNRYKDGKDYIGEHRDDEKDLVKTSPIASLSLGQTRDFILKHADARGKKAKRQIQPVKVELHNGSLLMMNYPTNIYWYHTLPVRIHSLGVRINLTFRDFVQKK